MPVWSPDGKQVVFTSPRGAPPALYLQDSRRAGAGDLLLKSNRTIHPGDWSKDGRFLVYAALDSKTQWDLWTLQMNAAAGSRQQPEPFLRTDFNESNGQFSPDGHWMAYVSDESGRQDVYVEPFPVSGNRRKISANGGSQPRWRRDGQELFYVGPDGTLMAVSVTSSGTFEAAAPRPLFKTRITDTGPNGMNYAVTSDGQRFLVHTITDDTTTSSMTVLLNWWALAGR
jgi:Periplasmic component of the Tol biopolymer transport system